MRTAHFFYAERRSAFAFWFGSLIVTFGVILHLPMFWVARDMGFKLAGMPMDLGMYIGMALILAGTGVAAFGLLPKRSEHADVHEHLSPPETAPLTRAHWIVMGVLALALIIDIMKPASLGFVTPGMKVEYGLSATIVSWLPFSALSGTVLGSFVWGALADIYGRRATLLLSAVMFIGTSICGAMPSFGWNVFMCFLMGAAAGGMLPVAYALLAEIMPTKHRGWSLVLVGGLGAVGGYFAASGLSQLLQPHFGWRIMWLLNLPTGLIIVGLSGFLPESAQFLQHIGRGAEARRIMARFGAVVVTAEEAEAHDRHAPLPPTDRQFLGTTLALTLAALAWGLVNFGLLLWLPSSLVAEGFNVFVASAIIAKSSLIALPMVAVTTILYSAWSTKWTLATMIAIVSFGLVAVLMRGSGIPALSSPIVSTTLLIVGSTGAISVILPYTAESYPIAIRGRATGWIAGCSKFGGLAAQATSLVFGIPAMGLTAIVIALPAIGSIALIALFGRETRGRDLRQLHQSLFNE